MNSGSLRTIPLTLHLCLSSSVSLSFLYLPPSSSHCIKFVPREFRSLFLSSVSLSFLYLPPSSSHCINFVPLIHGAYGGGSWSPFAIENIPIVDPTSLPPRTSKKRKPNASSPLRKHHLLGRASQKYS
ncbi:hypothetical protein A2U01_0013074, partial [Trifolium medium]|nr:hypothetical protein [Trifolium medium]